MKVNLLAVVDVATDILRLLVDHWKYLAKAETRRRRRTSLDDPCSVS